MIQEQLNRLVRPDADGNFGRHGGKIDHPELAKALDQLEAGFRNIIEDAEFKAEMKRLQATYVGRRARFTTPAACRAAERKSI